MWAVAIGTVLFLLTFAGASFAQDTLKVGAMFSQTGAGSAVGKIQVEAVKLAVKEVNDKGGVTVGGKKMKIEAVIRDDETKPDVAVRRLREYQNDGINLLVAGTFAHVSQALNEQVKGGETFVIVPNGIQEKTFEKKEKAPYFSSTMGGVDAIGRICGDYVAKTYKPKSVMLFLPDYAYGHGAAKGANKVFKEKYPNIKISELWSPVGTPDFTSYIIKIKEAKPDVVMMGHWGNDAINVLKQVYELGLRKESKIFFNSIGYTLASGVPADALDGVTMGWWWYHDLSGLKDPATENAVNEFVQKVPQGIRGYTGYFCDLHLHCHDGNPARGPDVQLHRPGQSLQGDHGQTGIHGSERPGEVAHRWPAGLQICLFHPGRKRIQSPEGQV